MRNITTPTKAVSFEDALRNLAAKLTGKPAASLPRTQEAVVQYMADNFLSVDELAEAITKEVMARLATAATEAAQEPQDGEPEGSDTPEPQEASEEPQEAPKARKRKTKTD
jgi:hypothetical protein